MNVTDYMKLPYTRLVQEVNDESGHYFYGRILELDGCQSTGDSLEELYEGLNEAMEGYIEVKLENGLKIPVPEKTEKYSGRIYKESKRNIKKLRMLLSYCFDCISLSIRAFIYSFILMPSSRALAFITSFFPLGIVSPTLSYFSLMYLF